MIVIKP